MEPDLNGLHEAAFSGDIEKLNRYWLMEQT